MLGALALAAMLNGPAADAAPARATCVRLLRDLPAGAYPVRADLAPAGCAQGRPAFRYDASAGLARAARDLGAGEIVHAPPAVLVAETRPGATLTLESAVGPVRVQRQVVLLRPLRGGGLLVRSADGQVFSTPAAQVRP